MRGSSDQGVGVTRPMTGMSEQGIMSPVLRVDLALQGVLTRSMTQIGRASAGRAVQKLRSLIAIAMLRIVLHLRVVRRALVFRLMQTSGQCRTGRMLISTTLITDDLEAGGKVMIVVKGPTGLRAFRQVSGGMCLLRIPGQSSRTTSRSTYRQRRGTSGVREGIVGTMRGDCMSSLLPTLPSSLAGLVARRSVLIPVRLPSR